MSVDGNTPRLEALTDDALSPAAAAIFAEVTESGAVVPELYRVLAHAPDQLNAWHGLAAGLRSAPALPPAVEVPAVLRVAHLVGSERQWRHQVGRAELAGLTEVHLAAIRSDDLGAVQALFDARQLAGLALASEIAAGRPVADATFAAAREHLGVENLIAVALKATYFRSLASLLLTFDMT